MSFFTNLCPKKMTHCAIGFLLGLGIVTYLAVELALIATDEAPQTETAIFRQIAFPTDELTFKRMAERATADQDIYALIEPAAGE